MATFSESLQNYEPRDIRNASEFGLFFLIDANKSYVFKRETCKTKTNRSLFEGNGRPWLQKTPKLGRKLYKIVSRNKVAEIKKIILYWSRNSIIARFEVRSIESRFQDEKSDPK